MTTPRRLIVPLLLILIGVVSAEALAHWCSNIWTGPARFVVKPEKTQVVVPSGGSAQLRVYVQNNLPFKLFAVRMGGTAPTGYSITGVTPSTQAIHPGQNVSFMYTISGPAAPSFDTGTLTLQMTVRYGLADTVGPVGPTSWLRNQSPTQQNLISSSVYGGGYAQQAPSLSAATLFDMYSSATLGSSAPTFSRTGVQQLMKMFGWRFCWNSGGSWRAGSTTDCPSASCTYLGSCGGTTMTAWAGVDQFPQDCMRAGVELGARRATLGSNLDGARAAAINAFLGAGSNQHKCLAAVVGAYLWQAASDKSSFTSALTSSSVPAACVSAAQRILGTGGSCTGTANYERAACAAADGIMGTLGPVTSVLMFNAGDGNNGPIGDMDGIYYGYMLYLVAAHRRAATGSVSFYPDAGVSASGCGSPTECNDSNPCTADDCVGGNCQNSPIASCCTTSGQCNDSDACTTDTCNTTTNTCSHAPVASCCNINGQCEDNNVCTTNTCNLSTHLCTYPTIANCCTDVGQCNDSNACTTDTCNTSTNTCVHTPLTGCCTTSTQCSDSDPCTTDTCNTTNGTCSNPPIAGCCTTSTQCEDSNICTTNTCNPTTHVCSYPAIANCCTAVAQCNDNDACTTDTCNTTTHTCGHAAVAGCCNTPAQCSDNNVCTNDVCATATHTCQNPTISGCCTSASQCDDGNSCTTDTCSASHVCQHQSKTGCCTDDNGCKDNNPCTTDKCNVSDGSCANTMQTGCCAVDTDCDDGNTCTLDKCETGNTCSHSNICPDLGTGPTEAGVGDSGVVEARPAAGGPGLLGGCAVGSAGAGGSAPVILLLIAVLLGSRRRAGRRPRRSPRLQKPPYTA